MRRLDDDFISGAMAFVEGLQSLEDRLRKRHEDKLRLLVEQQGGDWRRAAEVARKDPKLSKSWRYILGSEPNPESIPSTYQLTDEEKAEAARIKAGLELPQTQRMDTIRRAEEITGRPMSYEMYTKWAKVPDPYEHVKESMYRETQPYWGITEQPMPFVPRQYESQYPNVGFSFNDLLPGSRAARQQAIAADKASQRARREAQTKQGEQRLEQGERKLSQADERLKLDRERLAETSRMYDSIIKRNEAAAAKARRPVGPKLSEKEKQMKVGEINALTKMDYENWKSAKKAAEDFRKLFKPPSIWPKAAADAEQARLDEAAKQLELAYRQKVEGYIIGGQAPAQAAPSTRSSSRWGDALE